MALVEDLAFGEVCVEGIDRGFEHGRSDIVRAGELIHLSGQAGQGVIDQAIAAFAAHLLVEAPIAEQQFPEKGRESLFANGMIVLGTGNGELPECDTAVE